MKQFKHSCLRRRLEADNLAKVVAEILDEKISFEGQFDKEPSTATRKHKLRVKRDAMRILAS